MIGLEFAFLIGGLVVTEQVFNLNGIGKLFVQSVSRNDFTLLQGMVMLIALFYVLVNLIVGAVINNYQRVQDIEHQRAAAPDTSDERLRTLVCEIDAILERRSAASEGPTISRDRG